MSIVHVETCRCKRQHCVGFDEYRCASLQSFKLKTELLHSVLSFFLSMAISNLDTSLVSFSTHFSSRHMSFLWLFRFVFCACALCMDASVSLFTLSQFAIRNDSILFHVSYDYNNNNNNNSRV